MGGAGIHIVDNDSLDSATLRVILVFKQWRGSKSTFEDCEDMEFREQLLQIDAHKYFHPYNDQCSNRGVKDDSLERCNSFLFFSCLPTIEELRTSLRGLERHGVI